MAADRRRLREFGAYWLEAPRGNQAAYYIAWYDAATEQTRRRSLKTGDRKAAFKAFDALARSSDGGDPRPVAAKGPVAVTVVQLVEAYRDERGAGLASSAQVTASLRYVTEFFGSRGVSCLGPETSEAFVEWLLARKFSVGYVSRIVGVLRAAVTRAFKRGRIERQYFIPEPQSRAQLEATPPKGRLMSVEEIARFIDAIGPRAGHLRNYVRVLLATGARSGAILDLEADQILIEERLVLLNRPGRVQTGKYRPVVRLIEPLVDWARDLPPGPVVSYDGGKVASIKTAWRAARKAAGFGPDVTPYSLRYAVAKRLRAGRVPTEQISVQLGHQAVGVKKVTLGYSPYDPDFLAEAATVIAEFYDEVSRLTTNTKW